MESEKGESALNSNVWNISFSFLDVNQLLNIIFPKNGILLCNILFPFNKYIVDSPLDYCLASYLISKKSDRLKRQFVVNLHSSCWKNSVGIS